MTFNDALEFMGESESFRATVYAMNTLLIEKGIYTPEEFDALFIERALSLKSRALAETYREVAQSSR